MSPQINAQNLLLPEASGTGYLRSVQLTSSASPDAFETAAIRAWKRSIAPFAASQALDIASSYGMRELNPLLRNPDGRFGAKATTMKVGITAAILGVEYLVVRKWPRAGRVIARMNWGGTALTSSFAAHNFALR